MNDSSFDAHSATYDEDLARGLSLTGEDKDYYARGRIQWLRRQLDLRHFAPRRVLDFGCGTGTAAPLLRAILGAAEVVGVDPSRESIARAKTDYGGVGTEFSTPDELAPDERFDLVFVNGVFHHIPVADRHAAIRYIANALVGRGWLSLWENNPWNPGTRIIMRRVAFDRDAITLTPPETRDLVTTAGLDVRSTDYLFVFPRLLKVFRPLEPRLARWPLGGQYQILCQKPAA